MQLNASEWLSEAVARGSHVISLLSHDEHLEALTVREMLDVLAFKGVSSLPCTKRNTVIEILREILQLPCSGVPAPFPSRSERIPPAQCVASSSTAPLLTLVASAECDNHVNSDARVARVMSKKVMIFLSDICLWMCEQCCGTLTNSSLL